MAARSFWKGYLKLSLVTCPVAMMPAQSESEKIRFHTLNGKTGHRVRSRYVDSETGKVVSDDALVKGYPKADDDYVMLEDEDLAAVALESARTIDIELFTARSSIEWVYLDTPHYLVPDGKVGEEAFAVIREAMKATDTVGISRVVLYRRERAVMIEPRDTGIVLWTLRFGNEVRTSKGFDAPATDESEPKLEKLVGELIRSRTKEWSPDLMRDPVQENLAAIIASRGKAKKPAAKKAAAPTDNVIDIMDALKKSLAKK